MDDLAVIDAALSAHLDRGEMEQTAAWMARRATAIGNLRDAAIPLDTLHEIRDRGEQLRRQIEGVRENALAALAYCDMPTESRRIDLAG